MIEKIIAGVTTDLKKIYFDFFAKLKSFRKDEVKHLILMNIPFVIVFYYFNKLSYLIRHTGGTNTSEKMIQIMNGMNKMFQNPFPSLAMKDVTIGILAVIFLKLIIKLKKINAKKFRHGKEYGSARWGTAKDIAPYVDPVFENNIILTATESLMMSNRPANPVHARNKNVLVIGGSGSGKTRFFVKPNLMQLHSSYVITDPNGYI